jgi:hypothetical protein
VFSIFNEWPLVFVLAPFMRSQLMDGAAAADVFTSAKRDNEIGSAWVKQRLVVTHLSLLLLRTLLLSGISAPMKMLRFARYESSPEERAKTFRVSGQRTRVVFWFSWQLINRLLCMHIRTGSPTSPRADLQRNHPENEISFLLLFILRTKPVPFQSMSFLLLKNSDENFGAFHFWFPETPIRANMQMTGRAGTFWLDFFRRPIHQRSGWLPTVASSSVIDWLAAHYNGTRGGRLVRVHQFSGV